MGPDGSVTSFRGGWTVVQEKARPERELRCLEYQSVFHSHQHLVTTPGNKQKHEALPFVTQCFRLQRLVPVCSTCSGVYHSQQVKPPDRDTDPRIVFTVLKIHCPWTARKLICTIYYKQKKTDGLSWPNSQIANYKEASGHNFHGSHCNTHFPIFSNKKLLKKIQNENCSICVDEHFSTRLLSKCHGPVVPPVATPRNSVHLFESVLNRTI